MLQSVVRSGAALLLSVAFWASGVVTPARAEPVRSPPTTQNVQRVLDYLDQAVADNGWPGAAVALISGRSVVALHATGVSDSSGRALTPQTPVLLASVTKSITATAIMQLVEEGSIQLDRPVITYLPWFATSDRSRSEAITVAHLLQHTSGLPSNTEGEYVRLGQTGPAELERGVRDLARTDLISAPGESFHYANANYNVLGAVVEAVSGLPFGVYVEQRIFAPAGMTSSGIGADQAFGKGAAAGYRPWFGGPFRATEVPIPGASAPSAGGYASISDLARYVVAQLNAGEVDGTSVLSGESIARMHRPAVAANDFAGYAMGWYVRPAWEYLRPAEQTGTAQLPLLVEHDGSWANTASYVGFLPEAGIGVVVLVNAGGPDVSQLSALGSNAWRLLAGQEPTAVGSPGPWLEVNGWRVALAMDLLLVISAVISLVLLRRPGRARRSFAIAALLVDVAVVVFLFAYVPRALQVPLLAIAQFSPDVGLAIGVALLLTLVWGPIRTVLLLHGSRSRDEGAGATPGTADDTGGPS